VDVDVQITKGVKLAEEYFTEIRTKIRSKIVDCLLVEYNPQWDYSQRLNFCFFVVETAVYRLVLESHCLIRGINHDIGTSRYFQQETEDWFDQFESWKCNYRDIRVLNTLIKTYYMCGFMVFRRIRKALDGKENYSFHSSAREAAEFLIGPTCFYSKDGSEDIMLANEDKSASMDLIIQFTVAAQQYGGLRFASPVLFQYYLFLNWLFLKVASTSSILLDIRFEEKKMSTFISIREWLGSHPAAIMLLQKLFPSTIKDEAILAMHRYITSGLVNVSSKDMISRKMKDAIQNSGLTVRDTLRVIESCRTSPSVSNNETVETKVYIYI
jgi:hypothetical protein